MHKVIIAGMGPGDGRYTVPYVFQCAQHVNTVIAAKRYHSFFSSKTIYPFSGVEDTLILLKNLVEKEDVLVAVSGDSLLYSFCQTLQKQVHGLNLEIIPGIGSIQAFAAKAGLSLEDAAIVSLHGREVKEGTIAMTVCSHEKTFFLCSQKNNPSYIQDILNRYHVYHTKLIWGSDLTGEKEEICTALKESYHPLTVCAVQNDKPVSVSYPAMLRDCDFIRDEVPMTREYVRAVLMMKLELKPDEIFWDIGAGTGSISIEAARQLPFGKVYSVEKSEKAVALLQLNREKFSCCNLHICQGDILDLIDSLSKPDVVFIGGGGKYIKKIVQRLQELQSKVRLVMTAVTMETQSLAFNVLKKFSDFCVTDIAVSENSKIGHLTGMRHENTIRIFSCTVIPFTDMEGEEKQ